MAYELVKARHLDKVIQRVFGLPLEEIGFTRVWRRTWVRSGKGPIREVIIVEKHSPHWGFSLDYAPSVRYADNSKVEWHNTESTASFDLAYSPRYNIDRKMWWEIDDWHGLKLAEQSTQELLRPTLTSAQDVFNKVQNVRNLLPLFEHKLMNNRNSLECNQFYYRLPYAFTFAWLGRETEGLEQLALFKAGYKHLPRATSHELDTHFDALIEQRRQL